MDTKTNPTTEEIGNPARRKPEPTLALPGDPQVAEPGHGTPPHLTAHADPLPPFASDIWPGILHGVAPDEVSMGTALLMGDAIVRLVREGELSVATGPTGEVQVRRTEQPAHAPANALITANPAGYTFRRARRSDLPLLRRTRSWTRPLIVEGIAELVRDGAAQWAYLAEAGGRAIGYIAGTFDPPNLADPSRNWRRAVVTGLAVNPLWRRRGVGRYLVEAFQATAVSREALHPEEAEGVVALFTVVPETLPDARQFFAALGFVVAIGPGPEGSGRVALERYRPWWG